MRGAKSRRVGWIGVVGVGALAFALVACGKDKQATEVPEEPAEPDPSDFAPPEEEPDAAPAPPPDPYAGMSEEDKKAKAKELYVEAEGLAGAKDWENAMLSYEQAYFLMPGKHGFAFKVGNAAQKSGHCDKASQYLEHFQTYGDKKKHAKQLKQAKALLAKGCTPPAE